MTVYAKVTVWLPVSEESDDDDLRSVARSLLRLGASVGTYKAGTMFASHFKVERSRGGDIAVDQMRQ